MLLVFYPFCAYANQNIDKQSPEYLVRFLTEGASSGVVSGFGSVKEVQAAIALVQIGRPALPYVQRAIELVERGEAHPSPSSGFGWILYVYAKLEGRAAYERLNRLLLDARMQPFWFDLERAIAIALDLTSFRSTLRGKAANSFFGLDSAQDALNQLLLAWILDDRPAFEAALSPSAKRNLDSLLETRTWEKLRRQLLTESVEPVVGFGYRLHIATGLRSEDPLSYNRVPGQRFDYNPQGNWDEGDAEFYTGQNPCAKVRIRFVRSEKPDFPNGGTRVNPDDIESLLRFLTPCLSLPGRR